MNTQLRLMKIHKNTFIYVTCLCIWLLVSSCQQPGGNNPGSEFMPDMAHSVAYEANHYLYYYNNTWGSEEDYYKMAQPRKPVDGTVPRGYAGLTYAKDKNVAMSLNGELTNSSISVPLNGSVPYNYKDTEEDRQRAAKEIVQNPFPITDDQLVTAKELYNVNCGICHGEKGDGLGYLVREDGGKYPAQPANFLLDQYVTMSNGQYYHAIMHGKNMMGAYADKLSYEERWQVIHYIRSLQAKELKKVYSEEENTLDDWATPASQIASVDETIGVEKSDDMHMDGEHHSDMDNHGDDHGNDHH